MHEKGVAMYLGAHMSIAGGLTRAFDEIEAVGGTALQLFSRNQRQWRVPDLSRADVAAFAGRWRAWGEYPILIHDSYLINLASTNEETLAKSLDGFAMELARAEALGVAYLVTHPGSHMGLGKEAGIARYAANLDAALAHSGTERVLVLLENTAGQGTNLGSRFEELAAIRAASRHPDRLGVCFDTCHAFAAGYDVASEAGYAGVFEAFDAAVGLRHLRFFHVNDAKFGLGSRKDRHEHIGQGEMGLAGFGLLMRDPRFAQVPKVIETPKGKDLAEDRVNLGVLRALAAACDAAGGGRAAG
ncbi:MAG: deoxyribonuclease IV [Desulfovibrionaceae bacterium]